MGSRAARGIGGVGLALAVAFGGADGARAEDAKARLIMDQIVDALEVVLPLSLGEVRFNDPANHDEIQDALDRLARNSKKLRAHGRTQDAGFAHLSDSLARDAVDMSQRFADGRNDEVRFLLHHVTDNCVACHSRLPDSRPHPLGEKLLANPDVASLPADERAVLAVATRQFDDALTIYESIFADPDTKLGSIDLDGYFESYLEVCLRVNENVERPIAHLQKLEKRPDLPERLAPTVHSWIGSLRGLRHPREGTPIERARLLIGPATEPAPLSDAHAMVKLIAASGILHRFVASQGPDARDPAQVAEAYYLLGVIESRIGRSFWASQTEEYLEAAIRTDPSGRFADEAFALLEEFVTSGYTGSSGTHIPDDVVRRMKNLQSAMEEAREG